MPVRNPWAVWNHSRKYVSVTVTDAHPQPMEMFLRHPEGHDRVGQRVSRKRICACGESFYQGQLSPSWLDRMPPHQSKLLVEGAADIDGQAVWLPKACPRCERAALNKERK